MRSVEQTSAFKKDFKRESRGNARHILKERFLKVVTDLAQNKSLEFSCHDHALSGNWSGYRECHLAPDLLLLYYLEGNRLVLVRLGSHAEILGI